MAFKIYTKTGDAGQTALFGGRRIPKNDLRIDAYGTIDELNSHLGLVRDVCKNNAYRSVLKEIQNRLFTIGANLATDPTKNIAPPDIRLTDIELLENEIDAMESELLPLKNFILPGGHPSVSYCHIARTICRRAERLIVALHLVEPVEPMVLKYVNRLSDYLFVFGRKMAKDVGVEEVTWSARK
ncbi:MAG: cob(I)yrinic acid a,c-diamide adenosyltransferase [Bacteroidota bacterium]